MPSQGIKLLVAGVGVGVVMAAHYYYTYIQRKKQDETDEGIGDEDSIISDSEDPTDLQDLTTPTTIAPGQSEPGALPFQSQRKEVHKIPNEVTVVSNTDNMGNAQSTLIRLEETEAMKSVESSQNSDGDEKRASLDSVQKPKKVLILGLDQSGKTALVETLTKHRARNPELYQPTEGFNVAQARCDGVTLNIMEVGGGAGTRKYWPNFLKDTDLLVYVLDASDHGRFNESKNALSQILEEDLLAEVPCLLLANKQDIKGAASSDDIISDEDLAKLSFKRPLKFTLLESVCVPTVNSVVKYSDTLMAVILSILE